MASGNAIHPAPNSLPTPHSQSTWTVTDSSTVKVRWGDGFTGMTGELKVRGDTLHGTLRTYRDVRPSPSYEAPLRAVRIDCDAPPEFHFDDQRFLIRTVELTGGFRITLGEPVRPRDEILGEFNKTAYFVRRASSGMLGGSKDVRVRVGKGDTAVSLRLNYSGISLSEIKNRIVSAVGPPNGHDSPQLPDQHFLWENRMTRIRLQAVRTRRGEEQVRLTMTDRRIPYWIPERFR